MIPRALRIALALLLVAQAGFGATITVTSLADNTTVNGQVTLREAIQAANTDTSVDGSTAGSGADTIQFNGALSGNIDLTIVGDTSFGNSALLVSSNITIVGPTANSITIRRNSGSMRLFLVSGSGVLTVRFLTLSNGTAVGGDGGNAQLGGAGGGAAGMGGAICVLAGSLTVDSCTLTGNSATGGNAGAFVAGSGRNGTAGGNPNGGAQAVAGGAPVNGNPATGIAGGGGGGATGGAMGVNGGTGGNGGFGGGAGGGGGGANGGGSGAPAGTAGTFGGTGQAGSNGGIGIGGGGGGGGGAGLGGAIFGTGVNITITNSTISGNTSTAGGGSGSGGPGSARGGGVFVLNGSLTINNSTINGNAGGGVHAHSTTGSVATVVIRSTIIANSTSQNDYIQTVTGGTVNSSGTNNIIETNTGFGGSTVSTADPALSALASNGGPTQTHLPGGTSPALGQGSNPLSLTVDQRGTGFPRVVGAAIDVGAVEIPVPSEMDVSRGATAVIDGMTDSLTGSFPAGMGSVITYTIANSGSGSLTLTNPAAITAQTNCTVSITAAPATPVASLASTTTDLTVTPASAGAFSFNYSIANNDPNENPYDFTVSGNATGAEMDVTRGATPIANGSMDNVGSAFTIGVASNLSYTITNNGNVNLTLTNPATIGSLTNCTANIMTPPGTPVASSSNTVTVLTVTPTAASFSFTYNIANNDPNENPYGWTVNGTASAPAPEMDVTRGATPVINTGTDALGNIPAGSAQTVTYTIDNSGTAGLTLNGSPSLVAVTAGTNVSSATLTTPPASSVAASMSTTFVVTYTVTAPGSFDFSVSIPNNDSNENPYNWTASGTGLAAPEMDVFRGLTAISDAGTDALGSVTTGSASSFTYRVENNGTGALTLTTPITISGQSNCTVNVTTQPGTTVAVAAMSNFVVEITPLAAGTFSFTISIANDDGNENPYDWTVSGTGTTSGGGGGKDGDDDGGCSTGEHGSLLALLSLIAVLGFWLRRRFA